MTGKVSREQGEALEAAYRRARGPKDFDEVSRAMALAADGWKTDGDVYSHLLRNANDLEELEDDDPPALREALAKARVRL